MPDTEEALDSSSSFEPPHRRWTCIGGGNLRCDLRKVTLWVLLIVMALATWGLWILLGDIQESFHKRQKTAEMPVKTQDAGVEPSVEARE